MISITYEQVIKYVDDIKPNSFTKETKFHWLNTLEGKIAADVMLMSYEDMSQFEYTYASDKDTELLVVFPHTDIYIYWLSAKIDEANGEYNKYQNTMDSYNAAYADFVRWFAATYEPAQMPEMGYRGKYPVGTVVRTLNRYGNMSVEDVLQLSSGIYYVDNAIEGHAGTSDISIQGLIEITEEGVCVYNSGTKYRFNEDLSGISSIITYSFTENNIGDI